MQSESVRNMLNLLCGNRRDSYTDQGFTLIELLSVVSIIGILASIAVPQFSSYRQGGFDRRAQLDLRTVAVAEEAYFLDYGKYKSCNQSNCPSILSGTGSLSTGVVLNFAATPNGFVGTASHAQGTGQNFTWSQ